MNKTTENNEDNRKEYENFKRFYNTEFSLDSALNVIGIENFSKREWAFIDNRGRFDRNFSFSTPEVLLEFIRKNIPKSIYVGAVYSEGPNSQIKKSIHQVDWIKRELIFDLDLTEYDDVRPCACRGKNELCDRCWELIKTASFWINDTLIEDFGIKKENIIWVFSGRRGVHAWIKEEGPALLDNVQRTSIIDYLTLFKGSGTEAKLISDPIDLPVNLRVRVNTHIYIPFFRECSLQQLLKIGLSEERAVFIMEQRDRYGIDHQFLTKYVFLDKFTKDKFNIQNYPTRTHLEERIILQWGPRIDAAVSKDIRRILRLPGSVHGDTGKRVRILDLDELEYFSPLDEDSIHGDY
ncbi:MAG: DNA primase small subunit PriS [Candidatus Heimdallarchaeota archaeon LC_3]|nr:MAG: DNA primase small subunit PriS [Candidatus Heimdallarchaeota archaeon LC_3]